MQGVPHVQEPFFAASMIFHQLIFQTLRGWMLLEKYSDKEANDLLEEFVINHFIA
jgi:hypothetical protein